MTFAPVIVFIATFAAVAVGRVPGLRIDRTGAALIGACLMLATGTLTLDEAWRAIHYETLLLLFGTMIVVANLRLSGLFTLISAWVVEHAHRPRTLLAAVLLVAGVFSAFFVNDTMCIVLTPIVLDVTERLKRNPVPYLLATAMGSNIGSVATITGNPQNMMVGVFSGIPYWKFFAALAPVGLVGLGLVYVVMLVMHRGEFQQREELKLEHQRIRINRFLIWKSSLAAVGMLVFFFAGYSLAAVALVTGALLLVTRRIKPDRVYRQIDFRLLVMFSGLFVVIAGAERTVLHRELVSAWERAPLENSAIFALATAVLANIVSNVPAILVLKPFIAKLADPAHSWLLVAMSSTLAGNLTPLGSVANLIVIERAMPEAPISLWQYMRVGIPVTIATILTGLVLLAK